MVSKVRTVQPDNILENILINYRWIFVILFLLPLSFFYDIYTYARTWIVFKLSSAPGQHESKVKHVQEQVRRWNSGPRNIPMCTGRPGWQTISFRQPLYKDTFFKVNINMVDILEIDTERLTVKCEPLVTMGQLSKTLIDLGWTLPVVPEMDDLTVGGMVMGTGIEASSHKYGLFQHICTSYELVLADGEVVTCSENENKDLFYAVPWSYGTLGFLTAVHLKIIPALKYMRLSYKPCYTQKEFTKVFTEETAKNEGNDFVEGLLFSKDEGVVMTGQMTSSAARNQVWPIGRWYMPWFFKHVEAKLKNGPCVEYIPLRHYFHRHTKSIFWELQDIIPFGNNWAFRYLIGWLSPPKVSLLKATQTDVVKKLYEENHLIQDILVPLDSLEESINCLHETVGIYPMWVCPFKLFANPGMLRTTGEDRFYVDLGVYGTPTVDGFDAAQTTRVIEKFVRDKKGFQMLYADTYLTEEEFREMFDHTLYDQMRDKLKCHDAFPEVHAKVCRKARK